MTHADAAGRNNTVAEIGIGGRGESSPRFFVRKASGGGIDERKEGCGDDNFGTSETRGAGGDGNGWG